MLLASFSAFATGGALAMFLMETVDRQRPPLIWWWGFLAVFNAFAWADTYWEIL